MITMDDSYKYSPLNKKLKDLSVMEEFAFIAAKCISGKENPDPGLLNYGLYQTLKEAEQLLKNSKMYEDTFELKSPQLIVAIILQYKAMNPDLILYGK